jgi:hypothetical protein
MTMPPNEYIALRNPKVGEGYAVVHHPEQPADYVHNDDTVWQDTGGWRRFNSDDLRVYELRPGST